jgi:D-alanyl-lipoteichoic acid acyltransferase DltB (MBOAT superfamily)
MRVTELPRCFALMHTNSELWRYFDTGVYEFIKNYLYIPLGGNRQTRFVQFISLVFSFAFVSYWHGLTVSVTMWSVVNFLLISIELFVLKSYLKKIIAQEKVSFLTVSSI